MFFTKLFKNFSYNFCLYMFFIIKKYVNMKEYAFYSYVITSLVTAW